MEKITGNEPINYFEYTQSNEFGNYQAINKGLTIRQHFAAMAMQGLLSNPEWMEVYKGEKYKMMDDIVAEVSVKQADALINALNQPQP